MKDVLEYGTNIVKLILGFLIPDTLGILFSPGGGGGGNSHIKVTG